MWRRAYSAANLIKPTSKRISLRTIRARYQRKLPLTAITCYDAPSARHVDASGAEIALVGDSLAMVVLGHRTTQAVTLRDMVHHAKAARNGIASCLLVVDLPFGSYEKDPNQAVDAAITLVKEAGVDAVKLEGGRRRAKHIAAVVDTGIAVMGHVGLQPQAVSALGGFRAIGRNAQEASGVLEDARAVEQAGAFSIVLECVPEEVAKVVTQCVDVPTIGIGSGRFCSGQISVYHDLLGIAEYSPTFARRYAQLGDSAVMALTRYRDDVIANQFPDEQHSVYSIDDSELERFKQVASRFFKNSQPCHTHRDNEEEPIKVY